MDETCQKKQGKDTARRNDITDALRKRGWRPHDEENKSQDHDSPVSSHTSASKIRKLARQDSSVIRNTGKRAPRSAPTTNNPLPNVVRGGGSR